MTIQATKSNAGSTRALSLDGQTLNVSWNKKEVVKIAQLHPHGYMEELGKLYVVSSDGATATLKGSVTQRLDKDKKVWFFLHNIGLDYTGFQH